MEYCSSFFEELDELVYISDLDTHKLIYMNRRLRQSLGYGDSNAYEEKSAMRCFRADTAPVPFAPTRRCRRESFSRGPTKIRYSISAT